MDFDFDAVIDRVGTYSTKWDTMQAKYGVSPDTGIAMWVAEMDFPPPPAVNEVVQQAALHGVHGYFGDDTDYRQALIGWMQRRHDWHVEPDWIINAHGLCNAIGMCLQAFSAVGDGVIIFSPVYHAFARIIKANDRQLVESPLVERDGRYHMDLAKLETMLTGNEKILLFCSPHNPGGRVWDKQELAELARFCEKHDLLLLSDEVHNDLVFAPAKHTVLANAAPDISHRLVTLVATTKTFNLAGTMIGSMVTADAGLRRKIARVAAAYGTSFNRLGMMMTETAWRTGDAWLQALLLYLAENRRIFEDGVNQIAGVNAMSIDATYLCWVNFADTGMSSVEFIRRVEAGAQIAANHGATFGTGGESFLRFNIACRRAHVYDAVARLQDAFSDLQ
ncbi:PatB family C-S lyase [Alphaproteobacteria bacterium]|nr:PatB family C-S lyase [Alphaproteobacteria bacterium]MDC1120924.1 PatB family C-S lyase [Alphaproteobacteria bacterium]